MTDTTAPAAPAQAPAAVPAKPAAPAAGEAAQHAALSPAERFRSQQDQIATERGTRQEDVHTRGPNNEPLINGKPAAEYDRGRTIDPDAPNDQNQRKTTGPNGLPAALGEAIAPNGERMVELADGLSLSETELNELRTELAARKVGERPQKPEDYKAALPADFKTPEGIEFKFSETDPTLQAARVAAKEIGLTQEQFSRLLGIHAAGQVAQSQTIKSAFDAEVAKLGPAVSARVSAVSQWLDGMGVPGLKGRMLLAQDVRDFERLITRMTSGHGSSFSHANRDSGRKDVSDSTWESWSAGQRMNYSRTGDPDKAA